MSAERIIDVEALRKAFNGHRVVKDVALQVNRGEVFGFLGPNGSGKTTTIRMICGLLTPDSGRGTCLGHDILTESRRIKQRVGYMTQQYSLYTDLTVEENLNFMAKVYGIRRYKERVFQVLKDMGLIERRAQLTAELSGGWKQRVALGASLLHEPDLLLLDEPTAGIDPLARRAFWDTIHALSERGVTVLMSTHYMDEAERCSRLAYLAYGHLVVTGTVKEVIAMTGLKTWAIRGDEVTMPLLHTVKQVAGVTQATFFGRQIHVCGFDVPTIERGIESIIKGTSLYWKAIEPTLEDAFIHLVQQGKKNACLDE